MVGAALAAAAVLAGCGESRFFAPEPASRQGDDILGLWRYMLITGLAVGAVVYALIVFVLVRYRRRSDDVPGQRPEIIRLELVYTAIPIVIVAVIFVFTVIRTREVNALSDEPDLEVEVLGFQWQWQFTYLDHDVTVTGEPNERVELVLPVDQTIRFHLRTTDVIHSFWVPEFLEKRDLIPDVNNEIDITTTREGNYVGRCAEFCGLDHWRMTFSVRIVSEREFESWLEDQPA